MIIVPSNVAAAIQSDPSWPSVTLSLKDIGINGATNSSFRDDGPFNFLPTRNGDVTQGTFSPFGGAGQWSAYFDGSGDSLTAPSPVGSLGTGTFSVEAWVFPISTTSSYPAVFGNYTNWAAGAFGLFVNHGSAPGVYSAGTNAGGLALKSTTSVQYNTWTHLAVVRNSSGLITLYVNGVPESTYSSGSESLNGTSAGVGYIGSLGGGASYDFKGYISNLRVTNTAVYTSAFTPPTALLTAIAGTTLLTLQNSRFKDNSANNYTITKNGDTSVSRFNPFGSAGVVATTNLASAGSVYFDGTGDYLTVPNSPLDSDIGSGDFTVEVMACTEAALQSRPSLWSSGSFVIYAGRTPGKYTVYINNTEYISADMTYGVWQHLALVRSGTTVTLYVNGVNVGTATSSVSFINATVFSVGSGSTFSAANSYYGYLSNFRIVNSAVYTSGFVPPTSPLTAISGTSLLTCQDAVTVTDASSNNFTVTKVGDAKAVEASPFKRVTYPYGGSAYFDGNGDYLSVPGSTIAFGTGDFTVECWVNPSTWTGTGYNNFISGNEYGAIQFCKEYSTTNLTMQIYGIGTIVTSSAYPAVGTWSHVVVARKGTTISLFVNGVRTGTATSSHNITCVNPAFVGWCNSNSQYYNGYISNLRVVKGSAVYDPTVLSFTPPVAPVEPVGGTSLLLNFDNAGVYDSSGSVDLQTVGDAKTSTAVTKFGADPSTYFDGTGDWLTVPDSPTLRLGSGSFTVEFWIYPTSLSGYRTILGKGYNEAGSIVLQTGSGDGKIIVYSGGTSLLSSATALTTNTWNHVAVVRNGTALAIYINGTAAGTVTNSTDLNSTKKFQIGDSYDGATSGYPTVGYIQDVRVTRSARYTSNFSVPSASFLAK